MSKTERVFHDRIISRNLWPARSSDMNPCDFYLWSTLKNAVYNTNTRTKEKLKRNIRDELNKISREDVQRVMGNFIKVPKIYRQRRWTVPAPPSIQLASTTIYKIVKEMCVVVSLQSYADHTQPRVRQQRTVKSPLLLSALVLISL